jgi:hypothetical protein
MKIIVTSKKQLWIPLIFFVIIGCGKIKVCQSGQVVAQFERITFNIGCIDPTGNPMNPDSITLDLLLTSPTGENIIVPGYAKKDVKPLEKYVKADQKDSIRTISYQPYGNWLWSIHFCPSDTGEYCGFIQVVTRGDTISSNKITFRVRSSNSRGMIRIAKNNPFAFEYDNGEPYIPIGHNLCWASEGTDEKDRLVTYSKWLDAMTENSCNYIRLWIGAAWCFRIQDREPYTINQEGAFMLDSILRMCESRGMAAKFCFDYVRTFNPEHFNYRDDYPYMKKNGGPAETENEFLTLTAAIKQWNAFQRYCVARWGASVAIFTWEQWNEMDAMEADYDMIADWTGEVCAYIKKIDPYKHLISNSLGSEGDMPRMWEKKSVDYVTYHDYAGYRHPGVAQYDIYGPAMLQLKKYGKPVMLNECGLVNDRWLQYKPSTHPKFAGYQEGPKDSLGYAFHEALWIGFFAGGAGTGMHWWWDYMMDPWGDTYYPQYKAFAAFVKGLPINTSSFPDVSVSTNLKNLKVWARSANWGTIAWVINTHDKWQNLVLEKKEPEVVKTAKLTLPVNSPGTYSVRFQSPWSGDIIREEEVNTNSNQITVNIPEFKIDVLVKVLKAK